jgi:hypothetical protein
MSDDDAYMALVTSNSQSELTPLERGLHALGATVKGDPEKGVRAYAGRVGRTQQIVAREVAAARVWKAYNLGCKQAPIDLSAKALAEIHAAPEWLWPALVERLVVDGWTVEVTRKQVEPA